MNENSLIIEKLLNYFDAYNEKNLEKTLSFLDDSCVAKVENEEENKTFLIKFDKMKKSYLLDFNHPDCGVEIVENPQVISENEISIRVFCKLYTKIHGKTVHITYFLRKSDQKQIKHVIHKVE